MNSSSESHTEHEHRPSQEPQSLGLERFSSENIHSPVAFDEARKMPESIHHFAQCRLEPLKFILFDLNREIPI
jgi:hypothetical protein